MRKKARHIHTHARTHIETKEIHHRRTNQTKGIKQKIIPIHPSIHREKHSGMFRSLETCNQTAVITVLIDYAFRVRNARPCKKESTTLSVGE